MVTTAGKVVIVIGLIVMLTGLFVTMSTIVGLFMIFAGIITIMQGARMQPLAGPTPQRHRNPNYYNPNGHYVGNTGLDDTWKIKKDPNSKGAI